MKKLPPTPAMKQSASQNFKLTSLLILVCSSLAAQNVLDGVYVREGTEVVLEATITDEKTKEPVDSVKVRVIATIGFLNEALTNANGKVRTWFAPNVTHKVLLDKKGYISTVDIFEIKNGPDTLRVNFKLVEN